MPRSPIPPGHSNAANASEQASIAHTRSVWVAWMYCAMSGSATFSGAIAATTAAKARETTAITRPGWTTPDG